MKAAIIAAFMTVTSILGSLIAGEVEGRYFPVTINTVIVQAVPVGETRTRIWGEFDKARQCDFEAIEFRLGNPGASTRVDLALEEGAKWRETGREAFGPWLVQLTPDQLENRAYAVVHHQCYIFGLPRPWLTKTRFYP